jgi:hypothetical protein
MYYRKIFLVLHPTMYRAHAQKNTMPKNDLTTPVKPLLSLHRSSGLTISGV